MFMFIAGAALAAILVCWAYETRINTLNDQYLELLIDKMRADRKLAELEAEADMLAADVVERDIEIADQAETINAWVQTQLGRPVFEGNDPSYDWPIPYTIIDAVEGR